MRLPSRTCPLCRGAMVLRDRSVLRRFLGFVIVYWSVFAALYSLPEPRPRLLAGAGLAALAGLWLARHHYRWWCRQCGHVVRPTGGEIEAIEES